MLGIQKNRYPLISVKTAVIKSAFDNAVKCRFNDQNLRDERRRYVQKTIITIANKNRSNELQ